FSYLFAGFSPGAGIHFDDAAGIGHSAADAAGSGYGACDRWISFLLHLGTIPAISAQRFSGKSDATRLVRSASGSHVGRGVLCLRARAELVPDGGRAADRILLRPHLDPVPQS